MTDRVLPSREDALAAVGWFFAGPYLDHVGLIDDIDSIVDLWRTDLATHARVLLEIKPFTSVSQLCEDLLDPDVAVTIRVVTDDG